MGNQLRRPIFLFNFITKLIFCLFKIFGSPLILAYYAFVLFLVFIISLRIPSMFLEEIANWFVMLFTSIFGMTTRIPKTSYVYDAEKDEYVKDTSEEASFYQGYEPFVYLFGMVFPYQLFSHQLAKNYGEGGIGVLIIIISVFAALVVILGGLNIMVIMGVFVWYIYQVITGLKEASTKSAS